MYGGGGGGVVEIQKGKNGGLARLKGKVSKIAKIEVFESTPYEKLVAMFGLVCD